MDATIHKFINKISDDFEVYLFSIFNKFKVTFKSS